MRPKRKMLMVDDHVVVRESLAMLLALRLPELALRQAGSLDEALALLGRQPDIDLVLLDLDLPDSRGLATLAALRAGAPGVAVVVLSAQDAPEQVLAAIDQGAAGFVSKTVDAQALLAAVQRVVAGGVVVPAEGLGEAAATPGRADGPGAATADATDGLGLSDRQRDVLRLLVEGLPDKLICRELDLGHATVKTHLQAVFRKLGVHTRTQAVLAVARRGGLAQG